MALNIKEINRVLQKYPLCHGKLIGNIGMVQGYCAMGAIAKDMGVSDEDLRHKHDHGGVSIFNEFQSVLRERFGIETLNEFQNLMRTNDTSSNHNRNERVRETATLMAVEDVAELFRQAELAGNVTEGDPR